MDGVIVIRKEKGFTSHDVVAKLRGILHMKKIGHTGTLDPDAEGVLPVALGKATRLVDMITDKEKTYEAVMRLGVVTDTQDMSGTVLSQTTELSVTEEELCTVVSSFVGDYMQVPPMYSALKVNGKKLYELAREGKTVERKPRPVHFYEIEILDISFPLVRFRVTCSKGTYIRTLCHDIGEKLGCGAAMESLLRTKVGRFTLDDAITLAQTEEAVQEGIRLGYTEGYLRKSVVGDPVLRVNTGDNTPGVLYYEIVPGDRVTIQVAPKGFGSENMSRVFMLKPADGLEGVKNAILTAVKDAGPNACPPMVVGVGVGGTFEKCALMAKKALLRTTGEHSEIEWVSNLEKEVLQELNQTGIGPGGLGGTTTVLAVHVNTYPTHIAGLPVAVNICCHVNRHAKREL